MPAMTCSMGKGPVCWPWCWMKIFMTEEARGFSPCFVSEAAGAGTRQGKSRGCGGTDASHFPSRFPQPGPIDAGFMNRRNFIGLSAAAVSLGPARAADAAEKPLIRFGLVTDVQYADADPEGERHFRESIPKLKDAVAWLAKQDLPFTLHLGDLIDRDFASFDTILPLLEPLGHPVRHLLGNHDFTMADTDKARVAAKMGLPGDHYSFIHSGVKFVMMDTNDVSTYKYPAGNPRTLEAEVMLEKLVTEKFPGAKPWNGGVSPGQLAWLEKELTAADAAGQPAIVCGHHPLLPDDPHLVWNRQEVLAVLDKHACVRAFFNGHYHAGAEAVRNGVPFITFNSLLHEPGVTAYCAVRLHADRLEIEGHGREVTRTIPLKPA
ncbi:MAG: phosphatase [Verrucomicrobiaceae bacterium]|nr:MAG: phosphatase [Verrucomicrobiaceae bacterium]